MKNTLWLVSYPKSGNTWFRMFLANYLKNITEPVSLDEIESAPISSNAVDFEDLIGLNPFELTAEEVNFYRPDLYRILSQNTENTGEITYKKTHDAYTLNSNGEPLFPEEISKSAVCFVRNPLDVCVSYANHSADKIDSSVDFLLKEEAHLAGNKTGQLCQQLFSWKNHVASWKEQIQIPVHIIRYEDMRLNPIATFGSIMTFMGFEYDEERLKKALINSDFKLLQQMEREKGFREKVQNCKSFFWKGKIGNYREHLSEEQIQRIVEYNYDMMRNLGYIDEQGNLTV